jgi:hypothetical protein
VVLAVVAIAAGWHLRRGSETTPDTPPAGQAQGLTEATGTAGASGGRGAHGHPAGRSVARGRREARARRDALRDQIARLLASREAAPDAGVGSSPAPPRSPVHPHAPGNLRNNLGGRDALVAYLNDELMPLANECIEQAEARAPRLSGMLDEELGAVVDVAEPAPTSNVMDPLLFECIRESAFSLTLEPPLTTGREKFEITLQVGPQDAGVPQ